MITRRYDVIVAGFRPGGLLAGALLAKRGMRILAINQDGRGPIRVGKFTFPSHRFLFVGLGDNEFLGGAVDQLTIHPGELKSLQPSLPSFQVVLPNQRVDVHPDERFNRELSREFPDDHVLLDAFYRRVRDESAVFVQAWQARRGQSFKPSLLQKVGMGSLLRRDKPLFPSGLPTLGEIFDQMGASPEARAFINAQVIAFSYCCEPEQLLFPVAAHLLTSARAGIFRDSDRVEPLVGVLTERMKSLQSDVVPQERIVGLDFTWTRLQDLSFLGHDKKFQCEHLIWNCAYDSLLDLLPESAGKRNYLGRMDPAQFERFSIHLAVDEQVVPVGMHDHVILIGDPNRPLSDGNIVWLSLSPEASETFAPPETRTITLSTLVPATPESRSREQRRTTATRMLTLLKKIVPFLEDFVRVLHVPMPGSNDDAGESIFDATSVMGAFPGDIGPGPRLPHWNMYHSGRESYPLLGLDGEIAAGILIAEGIASSHRP